MPVYNVEKYLRRCLNSILNQTYIEIEILLIDDGSSDKSGSICDEYEKKDKRINVFHKINGGQSSARNHALEKANGKYIAFIDSDDFVHPQYISSLYLLLIEHDCEIVQCDYEKGEKDNFSTYIKTPKVKVIDRNQALSGFAYKVVLWGKLFKRVVISNIRFPEGKINEDDATYYKFIYNSNKICITSEILYYYFQSSNSTMRNSKKEAKLDFIDIYDERLEFFESRKEFELLNKSYERYAIVLILTYTLWKKEGIDTNISMIIDKYHEIYQLHIKKNSNILLHRKILLGLFNKTPNTIAILVNVIKR